MAERFFIIDGLSQIFRSYYAPFRRLTAPDGEPTRATYVFTNMLLQLIRQQKPDLLVMAMDSPDEEVFRRQIDPDYKAHRPPPPEDLPPQIERILDIVRAAGIPILSVSGFEADDVIATLARRYAKPDRTVLVVSKDKDLEQLISPDIHLFDPASGESMGPDELRAKKGYGPEQAVEIQTLTGDTTDNVPGVKGVGPKKAADLIARYGSAREVVEHADELTPAMGRNVRAFADHLERTRQLVTLRDDVPLKFNLKTARFKGIDRSALLPIFKELGFQRLVEQFDEGQATQPEDPPKSPAGNPTIPDSLFDLPHAPAELVDTPEKLDRFLAELKRQKRFALDTETTHLNPAWARLVGLSFSWKPRTGWYLPLAGVGRTLDAEPTLAALRPILADPAVAKVGQNIKYDLVVLASHDVPVAGVAFDTMVASFVLDSARHSHGLDALARELLGRETIPITALIGKGKNQITFDQVEIDRAAVYAAEDADVTWSLYELLAPRLAGSDLEPLFHETEMPLVEVLAAMQAEGVHLDTDLLARMSNELADRLQDLSRQIHEAAGRPFNIDSPKQLAEILFDELGLTAVKRTQTGYSTDAETLETLARQSDHPVPKLVKEYRELTKLKSTYVDTLPEMICPRTGRVHASFHQTVAVTGRLSSSDPNLQNIPVRTELGRRIRQAFIPRDKDHVLLTADYSQVELRVLAHFCKDPALVRAFAEDRDIHRVVAAQVFDVPLDEVTSEQRGKAKTVNFGIIYGQTAFGLARSTGMTTGAAQALIDRYHERYPGIRRFIDATIAAARRNGFVRTILGRRRAIPHIDSRNHNLRAAAEREAVNTVIQGSAADLIKRAMITIHDRIVREHRPARLVIQVHDELVFDVPRASVADEAALIAREMTDALPLDVPLKVEPAWGDNWLESK